MFSNLPEPFDIEKFTMPGGGIVSWKAKNTTRMAYVLLISGGFGGGGGASRASGAGGGGGGGRGGICAYQLLPPSMLKMWYEIIVGRGGQGGTADNPGTAATGSGIRPLINSDYSNANPFVTTGTGGMGGGIGGAGTTTAGGTMGTNTSPGETSPLYTINFFDGNINSYNSIAGGFPTPLDRILTNTTNDLNLGFGTGGGGIDASGVASAGGSTAVYSNPYHSAIMPGGVAGGGDGTDGFDTWDTTYLRLLSFPGTGGGGNNTGTGGRGGNGGTGCGGGGGGAGITGGRGGNGGDGAVIIISW